MNCIQENKVNRIDEFNLIHDILKPYKHNKNLNSHYSPILHVRMNTWKGTPKFKKFRILLDSVCSSMIVMRRIIEKLNPKKDAVKQRNKQAGNITTNKKIKIDFT